MQKTFSIQALMQPNSNPLTGITIVIPELVLNHILTLCTLQHEWSGFLCCWADDVNPNTHIVEYPFLSGEGNTITVIPQKDLIIKNKKYEKIEFHTHPLALGQIWADKFSAQDIAVFHNRVIKQGSGYMHVLFTTTNLLTWGYTAAPNIRIGRGSEAGVQQNFDIWNKKYNCWR